VPLLEAKGLGLSLADRAAKPLLGRAPQREILRDIDLALDAGESLGIVGESGSGKTSLGRCLLRLYEPSAGSLHFDGVDIAHLDERAVRPLRARLQMIFQDPHSSLNPRRRIAEIVAQPILTFARADSTKARRQARALLERVGLEQRLAERFPHELSGGQRQRVGIARAIALSPSVVVADEIVSGLDVSTQAQILALLRDLRRDLGLALVFISHDLSVVRVLCDRILVLRGGRAVESASAEALFRAPSHPYTKALLQAIPLPEPEPGWLDRGGDIERDSESAEERAMDINGKVALVTGANRGIGREFVEALVARGAAKVYATARDPKKVTDLVERHKGKVVSLALDITDGAAIAAAAARCPDVSILINNAGINRLRAFLAAKDVTDARAELETNYLGPLAMCRAFAPVLKKNGGGAIVNMLSILARVNLPMMGSLCASKAAGLSMTQGVRAELAGQGTLVVAVLPGAVDTDMSRTFPPPKMPASEVARAALDAVEKGSEYVYPGEMAAGIAQGLASDPLSVEKDFAKYLPR
jgi:peptide/nickel transport system ATP-binding protein